MQVYFDLDNCLAKSYEVFIHHFNSRLNVQKSYIDFVDYDFAWIYGISTDTCKALWQEIYESEELWREIQAEPFATEVTKRLSDNNNITIITARPRPLHNATVKWLRKNFISYDSILFRDKYKGQDISLSSGILIEDYLDYLPLLDNRLSVVIFDRPWNQQYSSVLPRIVNLSELHSDFIIKVRRSVIESKSDITTLRKPYASMEYLRRLAYRFREIWGRGEHLHDGSIEYLIFLLERQFADVASKGPGLVGISNEYLDIIGIIIQWFDRQFDDGILEYLSNNLKNGEIFSLPALNSREINCKIRQLANEPDPELARGILADTIRRILSWFESNRRNMNIDLLLEIRFQKYTQRAPARIRNQYIKEYESRHSK